MWMKKSKSEAAPDLCKRSTQSGATQPFSPITVAKSSRLRGAQVTHSVVALLAFGLVVVCAAAITSFSQSSAANEHTEWVARSLKEIETVKVGMTRADVQRVFNEEGGLSTLTSRRYVYRDCPYIKVDVEFELVG